MDFNRKIEWYYCLFTMFPLIIAIYQILDYLTFRAFGITSILVIVCFSLFFFLRRNYNFNIMTIIYFYSIGFVGTLLIGYTKQNWLLLIMILFFWIALSKTISLSLQGKELLVRLKIEKSQKNDFLANFLSITRINESKKILLDFIIFISFIVISLFSYNFLYNLFN